MATPLRRLADTTEALRATSSRKEKTELLSGLLSELSQDEVEATIGFLLARPRQGAIGVGWATVARLQPASVDNGDAPVDTATPEAPVDTADFDELLDRIVETTGSGSEAERSRMLSDFLARCDAVEAEFVRRVLVGDSRQGALDGVLTGAVAKAAGVKVASMRRGVMLQGDLGQAAAIALLGGADAVAEIDLVVGRPIQPMLASTAPDVASAVAAIADADGTASVEWKLDGARIQVHVHRTGAPIGEGLDREVDVAVYTRNLNDVTSRLDQVVALATSLPCRSAVLDGELLGFFDESAPGWSEAEHPADDPSAPRAFQDTMSAFGTDSNEAATGLRPHFFDLMYLDGVSLIEEPLERRLEALSKLVPEHVVPRILTTDPVAAEAHLQSALDRGHEGVMVKHASSGYDAGRRGKSWLKVKPVHTLDLVVLAAEWGHGRRQGWLSNLHLGALDTETGEFVMVGKTFKGLTDDLLRWQTDAFLDIKVRESGHTVWVRPELVVEIALDGAQSSTRYPGGVALRFARVRGYRPDKDPTGADTIDAVRRLLPGAR